MNPLFKLIVKGHVWLYKTSGGRRGKSIGRLPVLLLTTRGRKSGAQRTVPVVPFVDGGETYVIASMGGQPQHPAWFFNLEADPQVEVQFGQDRYRARAEVLPTEQRDGGWPGAMSSQIVRAPESLQKSVSKAPVSRLLHPQSLSPFASRVPAIRRDFLWQFGSRCDSSSGL